MLSTTGHLRALHAALSVLLTGSVLLAQTLLPDWPEPNGPVHAIVEDTAQGVVFVGGGFTTVGPALSTGTPVDRTTGAPMPGYPQVDNGSALVAADGNGGWYMAGDFTSVAGQPRNRIAHVLNDGTLSTLGAAEGSGFDNGSVHDLEYADGRLFVIHLGRPNGVSSTANYTGPLDLVTGHPLWSQPPTNGVINAVVPSGDGGWYIGGTFTHVGGLRREGLARVSANGAVHPWDPQLNGSVKSLSLIDGRLYVGGCFTRILGAVRSTFAAFDIATEALLPLSTMFGGMNGISCETYAPEMLIEFGEKLYVTGGFQVLNGEIKVPGRGWIDADSGYTVTPPIELDGVINSAVAFDDRYLLFGTFTMVNGELRNGSAFVDRTTWQLLPDPWTVEGGQLQGGVVEQGVIYLRGNFTSVNGELRSGLAAWEYASGTLLPWTPQVDGVVRYLSAAGSSVYVLGSFTQVNGELRDGTAAVDAVTASLLPWTSGRPNQSMPFSSTSSGLFVGVSMLGPGQGIRYRMIALDVGTGEQVGWPVTFANQTTTGGVVLYDLEPSEGHVFVSGTFSHVNGVPRASVAKLVLNDASLAPFSVQLSNSAQVRKMSVFDDKIALCGLFTAVNGVSQRSLAFVTTAEGTLLPFTASFQGSFFSSVRDALLDGDTLYAVGDFEVVNGAPRRDMAIFRWSTGELLPYGPLIGGYNDWFIWAGRGGIERSGDTIFVHGPFTSVSSIGSSVPAQPASGVFSFLRGSGQLLPAAAALSGEIIDLEVVGDRVLMGGRIRWLQGPARAGVAALALDDGEVLPMAITVQGTVHAMALSEGYLYLGGPFTAVNGSPVSGVARVNAVTGALVPFAQPITWGGNQYAFEVHDGRLFMGTATGMRVHDAVSGVQLPWNWSTNGAVRALDRWGDRLYIGGDFTLIGGVPRTRAAAVNLLADVLLPWVPNVNAPVVCISAGERGVAMAGPSLGSLLVVDPVTAVVQPVYRTFTDAALPTYHVLGSHDDLLIVAEPGTFWNNSYPTSTTQGFHLPDGGRMLYAPYGAFNAYTLNQDTPIAALQAIAVTAGRIYMGGLYATIGVHHRHNLAVFTRPVEPLIQLDLRASLGGVPQQDGLLSDALRAQGLLPAQEPYTGSGFPQHLFGGGEGVDMPVFAVADSTAVVDWVLVELRAASDPTEVVATRSGLLRRDGRVVDVDGRSTLSFPLPADAYHVALQHRNHLGAMTAAPVALGRTAATVDLRIDPGFGSEAQQSVSDINALWPGDATGDGIVKYAGAGNDRDALLQRLGGVSPTTVIVGVYDEYDINLDGIIRYTGANNDRDIILQTVGGSVPTAVRVGQVP